MVKLKVCQYPFICQLELIESFSYVAVYLSLVINTAQGISTEAHLVPKVDIHSVASSSLDEMIYIHSYKGENLY